MVAIGSTSIAMVKATSLITMVIMVMAACRAMVVDMTITVN